MRSVMSDSSFDHVDCSPPGFSFHGISQARRLEWVPFPSPGALPTPEINPTSPALAGRFFTTSVSREAQDWFFFFFFKSREYLLRPAIARWQRKPDNKMSTGGIIAVGHTGTAGVAFLS